MDAIYCSHAGEHHFAFRLIGESLLSDPRAVVKLSQHGWFSFPLAAGQNVCYAATSFIHKHRRV